VVEHRSPLDKPAFEWVNDKHPYDFVRDGGSVAAGLVLT
jgi:hypothetical protein